MSQLFQAKQYARFLLESRTKYTVHSPFIYTLTQQVFEQERQFYAFDEINQLRHNLLKCNDSIEVDDLGAPSKSFTDSKRKIGDWVKATAIPTKFGEMLFKLADFMKAENILELGTGAGLATTYLGAARQQANITTLEGNPDLVSLAQQNYYELKLHRINVVKGLFADTLQSAIDSFDRLDFVYLDGNHQKNATLEYVNALLPKLHAESVLVLDDIHWSEGMMEAWLQIQKLPSVTITIDLYRMGLVFFKQEIKQPQHIRLRF